MEQITEKHKEWIIETVDLLKQRKARPDFERISRMLERYHGLTKKETSESLEALVNEKKLFKIHFKGNVSYRRDANSLENYSTASVEQRNHSTSHRIIQAIRMITKQTGDGVTFSELEQWLIAKNPETRLVKQRLGTALQREIDAGSITKLSDNCYVLTDSLPKTNTNKELKPNASKKTPKSKASKTATPVKEEEIPFEIKEEPKQPEENNETNEVKRGRPLSKRKKIKKTHGPDFENPLQLRRLSSRDSSKSGEITCDFCNCTAQSNREGKEEPLLTCSDCSAKVHPSCMDYSEELAERALNSPWQCMDCKTCCICESPDNDALILFCDACDKGFHMNCHNPPVTSKPKGSWVCSPCKRRLAREGGEKSSKVKKEEIKTETSEDDDGNSERKGNKRRLSTQKSLSGLKRQKSSLSSSSQQDTHISTDGTAGLAGLPTPSATPTASPRPSDTFDYEMKMSLLGQSFSVGDDPTVYSDASDWSIDQVVKFFHDNGHSEHADIFRTQEIDGPSLLLMRREDVLTALGLKLGPALKIYRKVVRLQQHSQAYSVS